MRKRGTIRSLASQPIRWLTRARLLLLGHEELTGLVFWAALTGFIGALASVAFREGIRLIQWSLTGESGGLVHVASTLPPWQRFVTPLGGGVAAGLVLHYGIQFLGNRRSVDYMEAVALGDGAISSRPTLVRSVSSLLSIGSGGSIGREGSMVQLAALIGSKLGLLTQAPVPRRRLLVACGAAAGISAAYNAPIAGALFVAEIVLGSIAMESFGPLLVASVTANLTIHSLLGYGPVFAVPKMNFGASWEMVSYLILGVVAGNIAPAFLATLEASRRWFKALDWPLPAQLGLGGAIVGAISIFLPQVWGNGYSTVGLILHGQLAGPLLLAVVTAKVVSTAATVGSGSVGGIFTPTLFVGAAVGAIASGLVHMALPAAASSPGAYALVGMGGLLAATTHAPLMSLLMIFEMTLDYDVVLPLMLACVTAHFTAKAYRGGRSIYHDSLTPDSGSGEAPWRLRTVQALVKPAAAVVTQGTTVRAMLDQLPRRAVQVVYVVDGEDQLVAELEPRVVLAAVRDRRVDPDAVVDSVARAVPFVLTPGMTLTQALEGFVDKGAKVLPVTSGQWRTTLLGQVSRHDVLLALQDQIRSRD